MSCACSGDRLSQPAVPVASPTSDQRCRRTATYIPLGAASTPGTLETNHPTGGVSDAKTDTAYHAGHETLLIEAAGDRRAAEVRRARDQKKLRRGG